MDHLRDFAHPSRQSQSCVKKLNRVAKILSCGCMIATAILFPLAHAYPGGLSFGAATLATFILTALVFHSLHIEPFVRSGPYTAPVALLFLLLAVLPAGSSRKELIPWLPLFIVFCSLGTVAVDKLSKNFRLRRSSEFIPDDFSGVSIGSWSEESFRTISDQHGRRPPSQSNRLQPIYFERHGPSSHYSSQGHTGSDITLSGVTGQFRPTWDFQTRGYFDTEIAAEPGLDAAGQHHDAQMNEPEPHLTSESSSSASIDPLLGPQ